MTKYLVAASIAALLAVPAYAQMDANCPAHEQHMKSAAQEPVVKSPYADRTLLPIKALTEDAIDGYRKGTGMGMAIPAEMNGYPGPRHILDLSDKLGLTADQRARMQAIYDRMHEQAVQIGGEIIGLERTLDAGFAGATMTEAQLSSLTTEIAQRQGKLRFVHLQAHLAAKGLLTPAQTAAYAALRGYSSEADHSEGHHNHGG